MPGKIVLPVASTSRAPAGMATLPRLPTATMRSPCTTTTPSSITSCALLASRMVTTRPPVKAKVSVGRSVGRRRPTGTPASAWPPASARLW